MGQNIREILANLASNRTLWIRVAVVMTPCLMLAAIFHLLDTSRLKGNLATEEAREQALRKTFEQKQSKVQVINDYRGQISTIEKDLDRVMQELPASNQIPELVSRVFHVAAASGVEFRIFRSGAEVNREFYAELPIDIQMQGDFAGLHRFLSGLTALPRVVTIHNIRITSLYATSKASAAAAAAAENAELSMNATLKIYRYLESVTSHPQAR